MCLYLGCSLSEAVGHKCFGHIDEEGYNGSKCPLGYCYQLKLLWMIVGR